MKNSGIPFFFKDYKSSTFKSYWISYVLAGGSSVKYMSVARRTQFAARRNASLGNK